MSFFLQFQRNKQMCVLTAWLTRTDGTCVPLDTHPYAYRRRYKEREREMIDALIYERIDKEADRHTYKQIEIGINMHRQTHGQPDTHTDT